MRETGNKSKKRRWSLLALALALAVVAVLTACQPQPYQGASGGRRVAVVGDSITAWSSDQVSAALATDYRRSVNGVPGIDLADGRTELVLPVVATNPDVLVIELGINSAREVWDSSDLRYLEQVLHDSDSVPCSIWVTPTALAPSFFDHYGTGTMKDRIAAMKASVVKRLPRHPKMHLADWGAIEGQHPEWFDDDHLHANEAGKLAYAAWLHDQVAALCA